MNAPHDSTPRSSLEAAIAEYRLAADAGRPPDREKFLARHPALRTDLEAFFAEQPTLGRMVDSDQLPPESTSIVEPSRSATAPTAFAEQPTLGISVDSGQATPELTAIVEHSLPATAPTADLRTEPQVDSSVPRVSSIRHFGDYEILSELGRGGMGVVYEARQISLNRIVALKMLKAGLFADPGELRRFQNEAETVALLDHPGIVPIYEVGTYAEQRYFSMKRIDGTSLVPIVRKFPTDPRAAVRLIAEAADAVAHAHARGILHRDLKPANILVDTNGRPHITDFGLAKRVQADEEWTSTGAILGTPAYMSPEQAAGRRGPATTATDVYGLGAVLYALLTGQAPFKGDSIVETLTKVKEQPPEPPSQLNARVPRDLETICLKCLEKDPRRRYPTANALADDLRASVENRPITARRVGGLERAWLWCRRKPAIAALSAATLLAVVVGVATVIAVQAKANRVLSSQVAATKTAETLADTRLDNAMEAIKDYYSGFSEDAITGEQIPSALRERLLARPVQFYEKLTNELAARRDPSVRESSLLAEGRSSLARILYVLGRHDAALQQSTDAITLYKKLAQLEPAQPDHLYGLAASLGSLGNTQRALGDPAQAGESFRSAIAHLEKAASMDPGVASDQTALAMMYTNLGVTLASLGDHASSQRAHRNAIARFHESLKATPDVAENQESLAKCYGNLGGTLLASGNLPAARRAFEECVTWFESAIKLKPDSKDGQIGLATGYSNLGVALRAEGDLTRAQSMHARAIVLGEALVAQHPGVPDYLDRLCAGYANLGIVQSEIGDTAAALESLEKARDRRIELATAFPDIPDYQEALAKSHHNLAFQLNSTGDSATARIHYENAITIREALVAKHPDIREYLHGLAYTCNDLGKLLHHSNKLAEAKTVDLTAISGYEKLVADHPEVPDYQSELADTYHNLAGVLSAEGDVEASLIACGQAAECYASLVAAHPEILSYRNGLAGSFYNRGNALSSAGRSSEAEAAFEEAIQQWKAIFNDFPGSPDAANHIGGTLNNLANVYRRTERYELAREVLLEGAEWHRKALTAVPNQPTYRLYYSNLLKNLTQTCATLGDTEGEASARHELARLTSSDPRLAALDARLAAALNGEEIKDNVERLALAQRAYDTRHFAIAARLWSEAIEADPQLADDRGTQPRYNAACAAALAASPTADRPDDSPADLPAEPPLTAAECAGLRRQALAHLQAELALWTTLLETAEPSQRESIAQTLAHWQSDPDLTTVRGDAISNLPEPEQAAWRELWENTAELLDQAGQTDSCDISASIPRS